MKKLIRFAGWVWLPFPWIWRGCWDFSATLEAWNQGWLELRGGSKA